MQIKEEIFGLTKEQIEVKRYTLDDGSCQAAILTLGGILQSVIVKDRNGNPLDVVLGFDTVADYENQTCYIGALLGRSANRIAKDPFMMDEKEITLSCNTGECQLHGGFSGFDRKIWDAEVTEKGLKLSCVSADGEEGYPGELKAEVTYALDHGALSIHYRAVSDRTTLCNLSNHAYFNLAGHASGSVGDQKVCIYADYITPMASNHAPDGRVLPVEGTPLDLTSFRALKEDWDCDYDQIVLAGGYDHNYLIRGCGMRSFAKAYAEESGICLEVISDMPAMQLYTGNYLTDLPAGKGGAQYGLRNAFCFETQYIPNAVHCPGFEAPVLKAGMVYDKETVYKFTVVK